MLKKYVCPVHSLRKQGSESANDVAMPALVYLAEDIDAIPKLSLTDTEMSQVSSLLAAVAFIRDLQLQGPPFQESGIHEVWDQLYSGVSKPFCLAQIQAVQILGDKFYRYLRDNKIPPYPWPIHPEPK